MKRMTQVSPNDLERIRRIQTQYNLPTSSALNAYNWRGTIVKNTTSNKIGFIIDDVNSYTRTLEVKYPKSANELIILNNIGPNPSEVKKYRYFAEYDLLWHSFGG